MPWNLPVPLTDPPGIDAVWVTSVLAMQAVVLVPLGKQAGLAPPVPLPASVYGPAAPCGL